MSACACTCTWQGKQGSDEVQVPAELLLAAQHELKGKAQMAKDLEMVSIVFVTAASRLLTVAGPAQTAAALLPAWAPMST